MRIAILQAASVDESLALTEVAGELLAKGHQLRLFLDDQERSFFRTVSDWRPELAVVQAAVMGEDWLRRTLKSLPEDLATVLVGTAATFDPEILDRCGGRWALQGEVDDSLPLLALLLQEGGDPDLTSIPGFVYRDSAGRIQQTPWGCPADTPRNPADSQRCLLDSPVGCPADTHKGVQWTPGG